MSGSEFLAEVGSPDAFFEMEVLEEAKSPTRFLFFSNICGVSRGRQRSRAAFLQRSIGFISVLVFISLGGFRTNRSRISLDWSFLG
jgi:hypothetical protein